MPHNLFADSENANVYRQACTHIFSGCGARIQVFGLLRQENELNLIPKMNSKLESDAVYISRSHYTNNVQKLSVRIIVTIPTAISMDAI